MSSSFHKLSQRFEELSNSRLEKLFRGGRGADNRAAKGRGGEREGGQAGAGGGQGEGQGGAGGREGRPAGGGGGGRCRSGPLLPLIVHLLLFLISQPPLHLPLLLPPLILLLLRILAAGLLPPAGEPGPGGELIQVREVPAEGASDQAVQCVFRCICSHQAVLSLATCRLTTSVKTKWDKWSLEASMAVV